MRDRSILENIALYKARMRANGQALKRILLIVPETGREPIAWALSRDYAEMIIDRQSNPLKYRIKDMKP